MLNNDSCGRRRCRTISFVSTVLALAGCQSFPGADRVPDEALPIAAAQAPAAVVELTPIVVPYIALQAPIVVAESDLIVRLRTRLALPSSDDATVLRELQWYAKHQPYLDRVFQRADRYLFHIVEALEARNMPTDLALLPIVESAFDPFAYSHGRAAGLWQIIPGTGKRLGLTQNWWFDGRRDVLESTRAALDYLEQLHRKFDGDWLLAVAGYNSGEGNVARAIRRAAADGHPTDFWGIKRYLPAETRAYVPRLLAIRDLVADPAAHGVTLPTLLNEPRFAVVETGGQIDMALAANLAGVDTDSLYALNAGVNRWATDPDGPHRLLIPVEQAAGFAVTLASLGERERVQWTRHRVKQGETLGELAEEYHTTAAVLREINQLRGNVIRAGGYLLIPHATQALASYSQSADVRAQRQQSTARAGQRGAHVVKSGESLWSISRNYGVDIRALASWNSMAPGDVLSVGRELVLWTPQAAGAPQASIESTAAPAALNVAVGGDDRIREITYIVRRGDSLYSIAQRFRVTVQKLINWNNVAATKYLQPGQKLVMFVNVLEQST
jgi:membrane-bound lytic murein transglycosylase D